MRGTIIGVALALPICVVVLYLSAIAAVERAGSTFLAGRAPANIAEAAATARADLVVRFLRDGQDPLRVYPVHPDVISSTIRHVTALEAAVWSHQLPLMQVLEREGAIQDAAQRREIACLAADLEISEMVDYLSPGGPPDCVSREAYARVQARTPREPPND